MLRNIGINVSWEVKCQVHRQNNTIFKWVKLFFPQDPYTFSQTCSEDRLGLFADGRSNVLGYRARNEVGRGAAVLDLTQMRYPGSCYSLTLLSSTAFPPDTRKLSCNCPRWSLGVWCLNFWVPNTGPSPTFKNCWAHLFGGGIKMSCALGAKLVT